MAGLRSALLFTIGQGEVVVVASGALIAVALALALSILALLFLLSNGKIAQPLACLLNVIAVATAYSILLLLLVRLLVITLLLVLLLVGNGKFASILVLLLSVFNIGTALGIRIFVPLLLLLSCIAAFLRAFAALVLAVPGALLAVVAVKDWFTVSIARVKGDLHLKLRLVAVSHCHVVEIGGIHCKCVEDLGHLLPAAL